MNKIKKLHLCILMMIIFTAISVFSAKNASANENELRGMWISFMDFEPAGLYDKDETEFTANADKIFKTLKNYGFNTVFFQVRPYNDAIYPSEEFKWCTYISPEETDYDPLEILISKAHEYELDFHAWINPYRINKEKIYNPAKQSTTNHIVNGVMEIIQNYEVDGIHFDDYFYPSKHKGYQFYSVSIKKRKENINKMLKAVYSAIKTYNPNIIFGVSPSGNIEYSESLGCDIEAWLNEEGFMDYVLPQIYWSDNYITSNGKTTYFTDVLDEWYYLCESEIPIYTGLALYKSGIISSTDRGWSKSNHNLINQVKISREYGCDGYVMFSYRYLFTKEGKREIATYMKSISGLKIKKSSVTLKKGKKYSLGKTVTINSPYPASFKYSSSKPRIASVSAKGIVKAKRRGIAQISVRAVGGSKVTCKIKVR